MSSEDTTSKSTLEAEETNKINFEAEKMTDANEAKSNVVENIENGTGEKEDELNEEENKTSPS